MHGPQYDLQPTLISEFGASLSIFATVVFIFICLHSSQTLMSFVAIVSLPISHILNIPINGPRDYLLKDLKSQSLPLECRNNLHEYHPKTHYLFLE